MLRDSKAFSGFSVKDLAAAKEFYGQTLGLEVTEDAMGVTLKLAGGNNVFIYAKEDHVPANFTILNFPVDTIDTAINELGKNGVKFEQYDLGNGATTDEKGVLRGLSYNMGPDIAWFKDPAGNTLAILQES